MADTNTQTQTTAAPPAEGSPASTARSSASPPAKATPVRTGDPVMDLVAAAFAASEEPEEPSNKAPTGEDEPSPREHQDDTPPGQGEPQTADDAAQGDPAQDTDPDGDPEELTAESELPMPKWLDNLPEWQAKRIQRYGKINRELREQLAAKDTPQIIITPTPLNPYSDVRTVTDLDARYAEAKRIKAWCEAHPEGESGERNGKRYEITEAQVAAKLASAEAEIEAYPDAKITLKEREQTKPWETARKILPALFKAGSPEQTLAASYLEACPEIATRFTDTEMVQAALVLGTQIIQDKLSGKATHVRMELDKDGKPILPTTAAKAAAPAPKAKPPAAPQATKPALQAGSGAAPSVAEALKALPADADPDTRARAALAAAFGAAA